jgi:chromosome segregation ATPase
MDVHLRGRRVDRIERRITRLGKRADTLLAREHRLEERLAKGGRTRSQRRTERRIERLRAERAQLAVAEVRAIMLALRTESSRTRERLDRELARLTPLEQEWERLREMFDALERAIARPALDELTEQWQGGLEIPDFPVIEQTGYIKPFPPKAILF